MPTAWQRCSVGCVRTTLCGTTGEPAFCWVTILRYSTSSHGTLTPRTLRDACTESSSTSCKRASRQPGEFKVLGRPSLSQVSIDTYVTGATTDHLTPWRGCYQTTHVRPEQVRPQQCGDTSRAW